MNNRAFVWQLTVLCLVCGAMVYWSFDSNEELQKFIPETKISASSYNKRESGTSGFYELCTRLWGKERVVGRWCKPYRKLEGKKLRIDDASRRVQGKTSASGTLIIMRPYESLQDWAVETILDWVAKGNTLIYFDEFTFNYSRKLLKTAGLGTARLPREITDKNSDTPDPAMLEKNPDIKALYTHLKTLKISTDIALVGGRSLVKVDGKSVLVEQKWGKGKIYICSAPGLLSNRQLVDSQYWSNFQFFSNLLAMIVKERGDSEIYFDENCHDYSEGTSVTRYFLHGPAGYVILQILAIFGTALLATRYRFGAVKPIDRPRKIANSEYIYGLASTYESAGARKAALEIIYQNLHLRIARALALSPHESAERLVEEMAKQGTTRSGIVFDESDIETLKTCLRAIETEVASDEELRNLAASCAKISQKMSRENSY